MILGGGITDFEYPPVDSFCFDRIKPWHLLENYKMSFLAKLEESTRWCKKAEQLKRDIEKRREVLQTTAQSETEKKKMNVKTSAIDIKLNATESAVFRQITYFESEKQKAIEKFQREDSNADAEYERVVRNAEEKRQKEKQKNKDKSESYISYCESQLESLKMKEETIKQTLEQKKALLDTKPEVDEEADKVLVRLKTELKQAEDQETENRNAYYELRDKEYKMKRQQAEEENLLEKAKQEQKDALERAEALAAIKRENDILQRKKEERWAREEKEAIEKAKEAIEPDEDEKITIQKQRAAAAKMRIKQREEAKQSLSVASQQREVDYQQEEDLPQGRFIVESGFPTVITNTKRIIRRV